MCAQLSAILSFGENAMIQHVCGVMSRGPICIVFDGAVFECSDVEDLARVRDECAAIGSEIGVTMAVKQWGDIPQITDESGIRQEWAKLIANGEAVEGEELIKSKIANMCLYAAVGAFKFPLRATHRTPQGRTAWESITKT